MDPAERQARLVIRAMVAVIGFAVLIVGIVFKFYAQSWSLFVSFTSFCGLLLGYAFGGDKWGARLFSLFTHVPMPEGVSAEGARRLREYQAMLDPSFVAEAQFATLVSLASEWAGEQERIILRDGVPLPPGLLADASKIGVTQPERVRLLMVNAMPMPEDPILRSAAEATGLLSPATCGLTLRHGIYIRADCGDDASLIRHELVHTMQYERLGGIQPFLEKYLRECITIGYPEAPMEQQAIRIAGQFGHASI